LAEIAADDRRALHRALERPQVDGDRGRGARGEARDRTADRRELRDALLLPLLLFLLRLGQGAAGRGRLLRLSAERDREGRALGALLPAVRHGDEEAGLLLMALLRRGGHAGGLGPSPSGALGDLEIRGLELDRADVADDRLRAGDAALV